MKKINLKEHNQQLTHLLLKWNKESNFRKMPWKGEKDPYKIWLSEIILQQTRVEQGLEYYNAFVSTYPTVHDLAAAPEDAVFKLWEGLGYYSRCRNLIKAADFVVKEYKGKFPTSYEELLMLPGVGAYTAAAIASFAYNLPFAVVDGNVYRVLARFFAIATPTDTTEGKMQFAKLAQQLLPPNKAAEYNQAIMDFGATVCQPAPDCFNCSLQSSCKGFQLKKQNVLPVKQKKIKVKERWFHYFVIERANKYALIKREEKDIWQNLFQFPIVETAETSPKKIYLLLKRKYNLKKEPISFQHSIAAEKQRLTHQLINFSFYHIHLHDDNDIENIEWVDKKNLMLYPFPKTLSKYISKNLAVFAQ